MGGGGRPVSPAAREQAWNHGSATGVTSHLMIRPLELLISLRYLRARTRSRFVSFISLASTLGIGLGVAALITVISVMNGFSGELRDNLLQATAHVTVRAADGGAVPAWRDVVDALAQDPRVVQVTSYVEGEGMLARGTRLRGARVEGQDLADDRVTERLRQALVQGQLEALRPGSATALIGSGLAALLGVHVGERVNLLLPAVDGRGEVQPSYARLTVAGITEDGVQAVDNVRVVLPAADAAALLGRPADAVDGVRVSLERLMAAPSVAQQWSKRLGERYRVTDWADEQASYFRAVATEKLMMTLILSLIVAVAAFNVVASLVMVVNDKRSDIAILRTLGLPARSVTAVFVLQGLLIGLIGVAGGLLSGLALVTHLDVVVPKLEALLHVKLIPTDVYYINHIPVDLRMGEVLAIAGGAFVLAVLATIYPARQAAATSPADALRYE